MSIFYSIWKIYKILIFHNLKRYDIHHKMDEIGKFNQNIYIYILYQMEWKNIWLFCYGRNLVFIASMQFIV